MKAGLLVIPFDPPVQAAACSIVGQAVIPGLAKQEPGIAQQLPDSSLALTRARNDRN
jgi:hypothetical protein